MRRHRGGPGRDRAATFRRRPDIRDATTSDIWASPYQVHTGTRASSHSPVPPSSHPLPAGYTSIPARLAGTDWTYIPTTRKVVALTFDAGANDDAVTSILATLQGAHVPATFFLTGSFVSRFAAIARRIGGAVMFGAHPASQLAGFAVSVVLATAEIFAIGLLIAAIAPSASIAGVAGTVLLYPSLFFAGPVGASAEPVAAAPAHRQLHPARRRRPGDGGRDAGNLPSARPLLVMAAYAIVFGIAAIKPFRWE